MKKYRVVIGVASVVALLVVGAFFLLHGVQMDVLNPSGSIAKQERSILIFATALMALIVVPIFFMLGLFAWKYRSGNKRRKKHDYTPEWHENKKLEFIWWGVPIVIIGALAVTTWVTSHTLDPYKSISSHTKSIEVQVVALQWKWLFLYPQYGVATVNELPIPAKTPIHFVLSADAPMSAFWVPALGTQIYTMDGMSSKVNLIADTTGTFVGRNTNINGTGYADMQFNVYSMKNSDFEAWVRRTQVSSNMMDEAQYKELTKAGTMKEMSYSLTDSTLYDTIVSSYMNAQTTTSTNSDMEGM